MENMNYDIETVLGNGDCFFTVLKEAFKGIPMDVKVDELRNILVDHMDDKPESMEILGVMTPLKLNQVFKGFRFEKF
jgi:hypothetical protein